MVNLTGKSPPQHNRPDFAIADSNGTILYDARTQGGANQGKLFWPSPLQASSYAIQDYPRFHVPPWQLSPVPAAVHVDPALNQTHGYDFRNNVQGDTYVFLLGATMESWTASRLEFLNLTGPVKTN